VRAKALFLPVFFSVLLAGCIDFDGGEPGPTATPAVSPTAEGPAGLQEAIAAYVRDQIQEEYIGDCASAQLPDDQGKICTLFKDEQNGLRAYTAGPAFVEFSTWLFVQEEDGRWLVVARFDIHEEAAGVPGTPWPLTEAAQVVVTGTGDCLNVREGPGLEAPAVDCLKDGTKIELAQGPVEADDLQWWRVEGRAGWVAADWLRYPDEAPAASPTPGR